MQENHRQEENQRKNEENKTSVEGGNKITQSIKQLIPGKIISVRQNL